MSGLKIRKAFLIQCIYLIDTEVKVPNIIWDISKTGERKLVFCKLSNFIYHAFLKATRVPFPGVSSLMLTTSEMILNISSENHVHPSIRGCRNTIQMSASGVNITHYLTSRFVHRRWKTVYLLNTYQVQALQSVLQGMWKDSPALLLGCSSCIWTGHVAVSKAASWSLDLIVKQGQESSVGVWPMWDCVIVYDLYLIQEHVAKDVKIRVPINVAELSCQWWVRLGFANSARPVPLDPGISVLQSQRFPVCEGSKVLSFRSWVLSILIMNGWSLFYGLLRRKTTSRLPVFWGPVPYNPDLIRVRRRRGMSVGRNNKHKFTGLYQSLKHQDSWLGYCKEIRKFLVWHITDYIASTHLENTLNL